MPSSVTCTAWVKRGVPQEKPERVTLNQDDLEDVIKSLKENVNLDEGGEESDNPVDTENPLKKIRKDASSKKTSSKKSKLKANGEVDTNDNGDAEEEEAASGADDDKDGEDDEWEDMNDDTAKGSGQEEINCDDDEDIDTFYGLDNYDDEDDAIALDGIDQLAYYRPGEDDPHLQMAADGEASDDDDEEDTFILPTDNMILAGRATVECSLLEVYVFNEDAKNLYCHHEIVLPAFPLSIECINYDPGEQATGNLAAVGSMDPIIDLWDLDVVNCIEPAFKLGEKPKKKAKTKKAKKADLTGHSDAVLDLSWNPLAQTVLASASVDSSCIIWDLEEGKPAFQIKQDDKVQTLSWHPHEAQTLLTGAFDSTVRLYDCRIPNGKHKQWTLNGEAERVTWSSYDPYYFFASSDQGHVYYLDARVDSKPVFTLHAHEEAVTGLCQSQKDSNCLVTASTDGLVKVWSISDANKPVCLVERPMKMGTIYCLAPCPDSEHIFAVGSEKELKVWDVRTCPEVQTYFSKTSKSKSPSKSAGKQPSAAGAAMVEMSVGGADSEEETEMHQADMPATVSAPGSDPLVAAPVAAATSTGEQRKRKKPKRKKK